MRSKSIFVIALVTIVLSGCANLFKPPVTMTPLEIQSLQSREYGASKDVVFRSVISVFQDAGYTISNADFQTGIISAEGSAVSDKTSKLLTGTSKVRQTKVTAFVERIGSMSRVRVNFVRVEQTSSSTGQTDRQDNPLLSAELYQLVFEKIENAIFIREAR